MKWGVRRYQNKDGSLTNAGKSRYGGDGGNSERRGLTDKQKKILKTGVAVTATVLAAYGAHKVLNDPRTVEMGKKALEKMMSSGDGVKSAVKSSAEYKIAKAAGEGVKKYGGKVIKTVGDEKVGRAVTGVGAMATTATLLKTQVKDLKAIKDEDGTDFDRAMNAIKKTSEIGESVNSLAKGPMGQTSSKKTSENSKNNDTVESGTGIALLFEKNVGKPKAVFDYDDDEEKRYQAFFTKRQPDPDQRRAIKVMRKNGYSVDQIEDAIFGDPDATYEYDEFGRRTSYSGTWHNMAHSNDAIGIGREYLNIYLGVW